MISFNQFKNLPRFRDLSPSEQNRQYFIYYSNLMFESTNTTSPAAAAAAAGSGGGSLPKVNSFLGKALDSLNSRHAEVTSLVPDMYRFWDDIDDNEYGTGIDDGGDDMYDGANFMNTNLTQPWDDITTNDQDDELCIPYTHTQAENEDDYPNEYFSPPMDGKIAAGDSYFGAGSKYFTNVYPGLFIMVADNASVSEFTVCGNLGSDGQGVGAGVIDDVVPGWTLFLKTNTDNGNGDPTVNHLILVPGSSSGITHEYDTTSSYDDHGIFGISDRSRIVFAVVARYTENSDVLAEADAILVAQKILEIVL